MGEQVFEAGMRVRLHDESYPYILCEELAHAGPNTAWRLDNGLCCYPRYAVAEILAPAPKSGQRWMLADITAARIHDAGGGCIRVEPIALYGFTGTAVEAASWLLKNGWNHVAVAASRAAGLRAGSRIRAVNHMSTGRVTGAGVDDVRVVWTRDGGAEEREVTYCMKEVDFELHNRRWEVLWAPTPAAAPTVLPPGIETERGYPADGTPVSIGPVTSILQLLAILGQTIGDAYAAWWVLARRAVDDEIARVARSHQALFAVALRSLAEPGPDMDREVVQPPSAELLRCTAAAIDAAEAKLPARGAIARWQHNAALTAAVDAYGATRGTPTAPDWDEWWIGGAAVDLYLKRRASC